MNTTVSQYLGEIAISKMAIEKKGENIEIPKTYRKIYL